MCCSSLLRSFPRKQESRARQSKQQLIAQGPRFRGDRRLMTNLPEIDDVR